jgi:putative tricarboxylic transport membrane protein
VDASPQPASAGRRRPDPAGLAAAGLLAALAAVVARDGLTLRAAAGYGVGPEAAPLAIAAGLAALSLANLVAALRGAVPEREAWDPGPVLLIVSGFVALVAIIGLGGGFIPATAILFASTATAFGRRAPLVDLAIGFTIGLLVYLLFARVLSLTLPAGPLEALLP